MAYQTNSNFFTVTTKRMIPDLQTTLTGTCTASANSKVIIGTGTAFLTEIGGDQGLGNPSTIDYFGFLIDFTNNEIRRVEGVFSDTNLVLQQGFTNAQAGTTLYYVPPSRTKFMGVVCNSGTVTLNGSNLPVGQSANFGNEANSDYVVDTVLIDASGGAANVTVQFSGTPK